MQWYVLDALYIHIYVYFILNEIIFLLFFCYEVSYIWILYFCLLFAFFFPSVVLSLSLSGSCWLSLVLLVSKSYTLTIRLYLSRLTSLSLPYSIILLFSSLIFYLISSNCSLSFSSISFVLKVLFDRRENAIIISFKGTQDPVDVITDVTFFSTTFAPR